jgi:hypothetical protein
LKKITSKTFDAAVSRHFKPIARRFSLPINRLKDGVYEIPSPYFIMRIRFGIGHGKSILVTLACVDEKPADIDDESKEYGIGVIAAYNGEEMCTEQVDTIEDFLQQAERTARLAEEFGIPYILGQKSDFNEVKEFVRERIEKAVSKVKAYRFPKNVREEWL